MVGESHILQPGSGVGGVMEGALRHTVEGALRHTVEGALRHTVLTVNTGSSSPH